MLRLVLLLMVMAAAAQPILAAADGLDEARTRFNEGPRWTNIAGWFPSGDGPGKSYALIVGVSRYQGFPSLASTAGDPERMRAFLLEKADFDHVQILTEDAVTRDRLRSLILDELPRIISENDRFLFYWSGHGVPVANHHDRQLGYLPLATSRADSVASMLAMKDILSWTELIRAKQVLHVLDTCFSGLALVETQSARGDRTIDLLFKPARHLLTATGNGQTIASRNWSGGIFTDAFIKGAGGEADGSGDGVVTLLELENFIRERVDQERRLADWPGEIMPKSFDLQPNAGEFFFVADANKLEQAMTELHPETTSGAALAPLGGEVDASLDVAIAGAVERPADLPQRDDAVHPPIAKGHLKQRLDLKVEPKLWADTIKTLNAGELVVISEIVDGSRWAKVVTRRQIQGYVHLDGVNIINSGN